MHRFLTLAFCLFFAGCIVDPMPQSAPVPAPVRMEVTDGPFRLVFEMPSNTWKAGASIEGVATLTLANGAGVDLTGSGGGVFGFAFAEVNGTRQIGPASTADCKQYRLDAGTSMTSGITKSGGFSEDGPDAAFYRDFFNGPIVRLPAGDWTIAAIASFTEGKDCRGASHTLSTTVRIHVTP
jgi:hypothetical protein